MDGHGFANHSGDATAAGIKITSASRKVAVMLGPALCYAKRKSKRAQPRMNPNGSLRYFDGDSVPAGALGGAG